MARKVNPEEFARKRGEILDAAAKLMYTKGYERMTTQDIQAALGISSGAFFHYFKSKAAVLEALIERGQPEMDRRLEAIVENPELTAAEKLRGFFDQLDQVRAGQPRAMMADLMRVWLSDENAVVREKTNAMIVARRGPLLDRIARQGVGEGVFTIADPDRAGVVILAISRGLNERLIRLMLEYEQSSDRAGIVEEIVRTAAALCEATERVLGAPGGTLICPDAETVRGWLEGLG